MTDYDVMIYATESLRDYCRDEHYDASRAERRAKQYLEGAFDRVSGHSISASIGDTDVPAPFEQYKVDDPVSYTMCYGSEPEYEWLHAWFRDYTACYGLDQADDVTMLLSNTSTKSGGAMSPDDGFSAVQTGRKLSHASYGYESRGTSDAILAMDTVHHEFAHYAMGRVENSHQRGDDYYYTSDTRYLTPMANGLDNCSYCNCSNDDIADENHCGYSVDPTHFDCEASELYWAYCCRKEW